MTGKENGLSSKGANGAVVNKEEGQESRGQWGSPVEFILSCLGYAVGLGNIWRFPWLCYTNGGGAFLIPYFVMLIVVGIPVFFMELIIGQYSGYGPLHIWSISPIFRGAGIGMIFITTMFVIFYCMILGYAIWYFAMSFQAELPWANCQHDYNTAYCYTKLEASPCEDKLNGTWFNQTCYNGTYLDSFDKLAPGCTDITAENCSFNIMREELANLTKKYVSSSEEYLGLGFLETTANIEETGGIKWELVVVLLVGWVLCAICLIKGVKSAGKVVYFTALFPYVVLLILMVRGALLPGSLEGVKFYITPRWEMLLNAKVWADAAGQIFFSLSVGGGGLMTFASYNKFHNNIYRDALIVSIGNCLTSVFAGFVIFSILGYMAYELDRPVDEVVQQGSTLAFVAYPTVVAQLPISQLWSVLFFLMLITLGLDSLFAGMEAVITAIIDTNPKLRKKKWMVVIGLCLLFWLAGLTMCTRAGVYWLDVIAYYASGWAIVVMALVEAIVFCWFYGAKNLMKNVEEMCGFKLWYHWWVIWSIITPLSLIVILIVNLMDFQPLKYGDYELPWWASMIGWSIVMMGPFLIIIGMFVIACTYSRRGKLEGLTCGQKMAKLFCPSSDWTPSYVKDPSKGNPEDFEKWQASHNGPSPQPAQTTGFTPPAPEDYKGKNGLPPPPSFLTKDTSLAGQNPSSLRPNTYDNPAFDKSSNQL